MDKYFQTSRTSIMAHPLFSASSLLWSSEDFYYFFSLWVLPYSWEDVCYILSNISSSFFKLRGCQIIENTILPEIELPFPPHQFYLEFYVPHSLTPLYQKWWLILCSILIDLFSALDALGDLSLKIFFCFRFWDTTSSCFFPYPFIFLGTSSPVDFQVQECPRGPSSAVLFHSKWSHLSRSFPNIYVLTTPQFISSVPKTCSGLGARIQLNIPLRCYGRLKNVPHPWRYPHPNP